MSQNYNNFTQGRNQLAGRIMAEKKKSVMALCLVSLMVFMWVKTLSGRGPATAETALLEKQLKTSELIADMKISFIKLPNVIGRNDRLTKDFFVIDDEGIDGRRKIRAVLNDDSEDYARRVAEKLKLEAICLGEYRQAFINGKLLSAGDKLAIADRDDMYVCEVMSIEETIVIVKCGENEIKLKLAPASQVDD